MRALVFVGPRRVEVREAPLGPPGEGQALVETILSAISAGTEMLVYRGEAPPGMPLDASLPALAGTFGYPLAYGYSAVGRVADLGAGVAPAWRDRLVFAFQPHASRFLAPAADLLAVPEGIAPEAAALLPNAETAVGLLMDGRPVVGERVAVFGQGVVGLLTAALLARFPLESLVTLDRHALRRQRSLGFGAHAALDPESAGALAGLAGSADLVYELSGSPAALQQAIAAAGFAGRVVVGSWYGSKPVPLDLGGAFHRGRVEIVSSQVSTLSPRHAARWTKARRLAAAWRLLGGLDAGRLITHRFPFAEAPAAYELLDRRPEEALQVLLRYDA